MCQLNENELLTAKAYAKKRKSHPSVPFSPNKESPMSRSTQLAVQKGDSILKERTMEW